MKRTLRVILVTALAGGLLAVTSPAEAALTNGGFESPNISPNAYSMTDPTTWFTAAPLPGGNTLILKAPTFAVSEGSQADDLSGLSPNVGPGTSGGLQQNFATPPVTPHALQYDWTSKCAGSDIRVIMDGLVVDQATNPAVTYPTYTTRTLTLIPNSTSTALRFDTSTLGPTGASGLICGTIIDNVRFAPAVGVTPTASPASQCTGATGHRVQFRKSFIGLGTNEDTNVLFNQAPTGPDVISTATDNGVAYINYLDSGAVAFAARPTRDVGVPPLTQGVGASPAFFPGGVDDGTFAMRSSGYINVPVAGIWTFKVARDDGFRLFMGQPAVFASEFNAGGGVATTSTAINFTAPGCYHYELQWYNGGGPAAAAFFASGPGQVGDQLVGDLPAGGGGSTLAVYQGTDSPFDCKIIAVRRAPSAYSYTQDVMSVRVADLDGIGGVYNIQSTNASMFVFPVGWMAGTSGPLEVRAVKITQGSPAFSFTLSDWNGNSKTCT